MISLKHICMGMASGLLLVATGSAYAVVTPYTFSITGTLLNLGTQTITSCTQNPGSPPSCPLAQVDVTQSSSVTVTNAYGLGVGSTITASGSFTADLGSTMTGTVFFDQNAFTTSGNVLSIDMNGPLAGGIILPGSADASYSSGGGAYLTFANGSLTDFDYQKTTTTKFNSSFGSFDDQSSTVSNVVMSGNGPNRRWTFTTTQSMYGEWSFAGAAVSPVPEASTYAMMLAGLGLVGLMGAVRRKSLALPA